ncbi:MAG: TauD/TfdA family dioxygenase [Actinomycetota bacterium]|jgi:alpha-ketoglutarate-dependent taurine dioxygenase|nr:TauD/TfdA family dioxygenase [Actinomycetota bacterium]
MEDMTITPMPDKTFGATVMGVNLRDLSAEEFSAIEAAYLDYGFLLFPDQNLDEQESADFGLRWGELEFGGQPMSNQKRHKDGSFGRIYDIDSQLMRTNVGNEGWHTDSTYKPLASKSAMLSAVIVPDEGGGTEFADTRTAYAELDQATKDRIAGLSAYHSTNYSQANDIGDFPDTGNEGMYGTVYHGEAYLRPLVKVHPDTGIPNLFVGRHAFGIPGLERDESRELIRSLIDFVISDERRVYSHQWKPGETLFWDNRFVLHRAMPYDYSKPRYLISTRVAGDPASELAYYPDDPAAEAGRIALANELELLPVETTDRMYGATTATAAS